MGARARGGGRAGGGRGDGRGAGIYGRTSMPRGQQLAQRGQTTLELHSRCDESTTFVELSARRRGEQH